MSPVLWSSPYKGAVSVLSQAHGAGGRGRRALSGFRGRHREAAAPGLVHQLPQFHRHAEERHPEHAAVLRPRGGGGGTGDQKQKYKT